MRIRTKYRLAVLLAVVALMIAAVPVGAAPPGSPDEVEENAFLDAHWTDGVNASVQLHVQTDVGSATGAELWLNIGTELWGCNEFYSSLAEFEFGPDVATATATVSETCWLHEFGPVASGITVAFTVTVTTLDLNAPRIRFHTNSTGQQCKGVNYIDDDIHAFAWTLDAPNITDLPDLNAVGATSGNLWSERIVCHDTGKPGKPPKA